MSSLPFLRNMLGQKLTEDELQAVKHPALELYWHVTLKNVQAFALLGLCVAGPVVQVIRGPRTFKAISETSLKYGKIGALIGIPIGPLMTRGRMGSTPTDDWGYYDRSYRIRKNRGQIRVDQASILGSALGAGGAVAMGGAASSGMVIGLVGGTLLAAVYNGNKASKEKKADKENEKKQEESQKE